MSNVSSSLLALQRRGARDPTPTITSMDFKRPFRRSGPMMQQMQRRALLIALTTAAVLSLLMLALWDTGSARFARSQLCGGVAVGPSGRSLSGDDVLFDRFAESAAEHNRPTAISDLTTLVMVAGHAIFVGSRWSAEDLQHEDNWILESFQKGQVPTFVKHIERGVQLAANDSSALLMFSGGQTRDGAGPRSEGLSYWMAADASHWFGLRHLSVQNRSFAEEYARDSLENLLFSICRFNQIVGRYPRLIKVVGFEFKRVRFTDMHRRALRFPSHRFEYVGIDPPESGGLRGVTAGERATAMGPFAADPYGCNAAVLGNKREKRNPYFRYHPYPQGCPALAPVFRHCGRNVFNGPLPWDPRLVHETKRDSS